MFRKILFGLAFLALPIAQALAQTSAEAVSGFRLAQGSTYNGFTCPAAAVQPCFVQYGSSLPVTGTFSASLAGFQPTAGSTANLSVTSTSSDVALPATTDVVVTNEGPNTVFFRVQAGAGTAVTTDEALVAGAAAGIHLGSATHISAIAASAQTATLSIQGGTGLVTGYGGGSSGGSSSNASVSATGSAVPASATYIGMYVGGNLTGLVGTANGLKVDGSAVTQPVSGTVTAAQATAANLNATVVGTGTFAVQNTNQAGSAIIGKVGIDQTTPGTTNLVAAGQNGTWNINNVSGTVSLPTGASTSALQPTNAAQGSTTSGQTGHLIQGAVTTSSPTYTTGQTDPLSLDTTGALRVNVTAGAAGGTSYAQGSTTSGQNVSPAGCATTTSAPTNTTAQTNMLSCGTDGGLRVEGGYTQGSTTSGQLLNPVGGRTLSTTPTDTTAQTNIPVLDLAGAAVTRPYALPDVLVQGTTAAMTGTTSTLLVAAPAGSLHNYITNITCVNSHATVGTFVTVQDGSGGTALYTLAAAAVFGGSTVTFPAPLRQPTAATGLYVADVTTGANVICSASGYKGL